MCEMSGCDKDAAAGSTSSALPYEPSPVASFPSKDLTIRNVQVQASFNRTELEIKPEMFKPDITAQSSNNTALDVDRGGRLGVGGIQLHILKM